MIQQFGKRCAIFNTLWIEIAEGLRAEAEHDACVIQSVMRPHEDVVIALAHAEQSHALLQSQHGLIKLAVGVLCRLLFLNLAGDLAISLMLG
jgi:hypothetical protein